MLRFCPTYYGCGYLDDRKYFFPFILLQKVGTRFAGAKNKSVPHQAVKRNAPIPKDSAETIQFSAVGDPNVSVFHRQPVRAVIVLLYVLLPHRTRLSACLVSLSSFVMTVRNEMKDSAILGENGR